MSSGFSLETLPVEVHHEISRFITSLDTKHLSQCSSLLQNIYRPQSWRLCRVVAGSREYGLHSRYRTVPLRVLVRPDRFGWFRSDCVHSLYISTMLLSLIEPALAKSLEVPFDARAFSSIQKISLEYQPFFHGVLHLDESRFYHSILQLAEESQTRDILDVHVKFKSVNGTYAHTMFSQFISRIKTVSFDADYYMPQLPVPTLVLEKLEAITLSNVDLATFTTAIKNISYCSRLRSLVTRHHVAMRAPNVLLVEKTLAVLTDIQIPADAECHVQFVAFNGFDLPFEMIELLTPTKHTSTFSENDLFTSLTAGASSSGSMPRRMLGRAPFKICIPQATKMSIESIEYFSVFYRLVDFVRLPNLRHISVPLKVQWERPLADKICLATHLTTLEVAMRSAFDPEYGSEFVRSLATAKQLRSLVVSDAPNSGFYFSLTEHLCDAILNPLLKLVRARIRDALPPGPAPGVCPSPFPGPLETQAPLVADHELRQLAELFFERYHNYQCAAAAVPGSATVPAAGMAVPATPAVVMLASYERLVCDNIADLVNRPWACLERAHEYDLGDEIVRRFFDVCTMEAIFQSARRIRTLEYVAVRPNSQLYVSPSMDLLLATHTTLRQVYMCTPLNPTHASSWHDARGYTIATKFHDWHLSEFPYEPFGMDDEESNEGLYLAENFSRALHQTLNGERSEVSTLNFEFEEEDFDDPHDEDTYFEEEDNDNDYDIIPLIPYKYVSIGSIYDLKYSMAISVVFDLHRWRHFDPKLTDLSLNHMISSPEAFSMFDEPLDYKNIYHEDFDGWV